VTDEGERIPADWLDSYPPKSPKLFSIPESTSETKLAADSHSDIDVCVRVLADENSEGLPMPEEVEGRRTSCNIPSGRSRSVFNT